MNALTNIAPADALISPAARADEAAAVKEFQLAEKAQSTRDAYKADMLAFVAWCEARGLLALPASPDTVCEHIAWLAKAGKSPSSVGRRISAVRYAHELQQLASPTKDMAVRVTAAGIRREAHKFGYISRRKDAATADIVRRLLDTCGDGMTGTRDRALISLGFAGAFRRSELVALRVEDLTEQPDGYRVRIARSKTDQLGEGQEIVIPRGARIRPVAAVQTWLAAAGIAEGVLFRRVHRYGAVRADGLSDHMVARIVKHRCDLAGLDPASFSGHSLRAGFLTSAAEAGASIFKMKEVSRHKSVDVLANYVRSANLYVDHAGAAFL
jgi:site-specific recombinase XerD